MALARRRCPRCGLDESETVWHPSQLERGYGQSYCKPCLKVYQKQRAAETRLKAILHYGHGDAQCACPGCEQNRYEFMTLDHVNGGGNVHRAEVSGSKRGGSAFYQWMEKNGFPEGFQLLCFNCNSAKGIHGRCPYAGSRH